MGCLTDTRDHPCGEFCDHRLREVHPIVHIDGISVRVWDEGAVTIKVTHVPVCAEVEGREHAPGTWIAEAEGAEFGHSSLTQPAGPPEQRGCGACELTVTGGGLSGLISWGFGATAHPEEGAGEQVLSV
jgi:transposase-like protein